MQIWSRGRDRLEVLVGPVCLQGPFRAGLGRRSSLQHERAAALQAVLRGTRILIYRQVARAYFAVLALAFLPNCFLQVFLFCQLGVGFVLVELYQVLAQSRDLLLRHAALCFCVALGVSLSLKKLQAPQFGQ